MVYHNDMEIVRETERKGCRSNMRIIQRQTLGPSFAGFLGSVCVAKATLKWVRVLVEILEKLTSTRIESRFLVKFTSSYVSFAVLMTVARRHVF